MTGRMIDISSEDVEESLALLKEIPNIANGVSDIVQSVTDKIKNDELEMRKGLSFLDLKNLNLLHYITNLSYIVALKLNGRKIENDEAIKRLVELRVVMEKMKPTNEKLKYQINKLLESVTSERIDTNDPLKFRANLESIDAEKEEEDEEVASGEQQKGSKVYVPPKISATYYDEDNVVEQKKKALEQARKRALSSSMLYELRKEYDTGPEEIREMYDPYKLKLSEELKERERYEEEHMTRLPITKKQRHEMRQLTTVTNFNPKFEDISALDMDPENMNLKKKSRGKTRKFKVKNKKKGFRKKH